MASTRTAAPIATPTARGASADSAAGAVADAAAVEGDAGPVQNFRWNMSPLVAFANLSAVGKAVPIHTGEAYDGPGTALMPAIRVEDFYMTSVSPAV